jgi:hypothetical protein
MYADHVIVKGKRRAQGHGLMFGVCCHVSGVLVGKLLGGAHPVVHDIIIHKLCAISVCCFA